MKLSLFVVALILSGCEIKQAPRADWEEAPTKYKCSTEQQLRVEKEALFCTKNMDYFDSYCYGSAYIRNCTLIDEKVKP